MSRTEETHVVIVGGGTIGLAMSLSLSHLGIRHTLFERHRGTSLYPRAIGLGTRTMELLRGLGLADAVDAQAAPLRAQERTAWYTSLAGPTDLHGQLIASRSGWGSGELEAEYKASSPCPWRILAQIRLEPLLRAAAEQSPYADVRFATEVTDLAQDDDGVTVSATAADGPVEVRAQYLVGADAGRTVAARVGITETGPTDLVDMVSIYFSADLSEVRDPTVLMSWFVNPDLGGSVETGILYAVGPWDADGHSTEFVFSFARRTDDPSVFDESTALARMRATLGIEDFSPTLHNISHWFLQAVIADHYRSGRCLLAGDAAHRVPPWGGLGMNTGLQDVQNLAWKLAAAVQEPALDGLLDSYEAERRPVAIDLLQNAMASFQSSLGLVDAALELDPSDPANGWSNIASVVQDDPSGAARRQAVDKALTVLDTEFHPHGAECGFFYTAGAFQVDADLPAVTRDPVVYTRRALPGHHLPHFWLGHGADGHGRSTVDLPELSRFVLVVDAAGAAWHRAAAHLDSPFARTLHVEAIDGAATSPDHDMTWGRLREVGPTGALLVRPDGIIAWRWLDLPADPAAALQNAFDSLTGTSPAAANARQVHATTV